MPRRRNRTMELAAEDGQKKRRRPNSRDDLDEEEDDDDEEYGAGRKGKVKGRTVSQFFDEDVEVVSDEYEEDEDEGEDDFIDGGTNLPDDDDVDDSRRMHRRHHRVEEEEEEEDIDVILGRLRERYGHDGDDDGGETKVEDQVLLPSVRDPKLWMVKCAVGREREVAVCLMQKAIDKGPEFLQIKSVIALDHLKNYIYIEAEKEAHVKEACKGMRNLYANSTKIMQVPIKEMTDVLAVKTKSIDISRDTWVRMKIGTYKGDLAKVVDVDNVRQKVTLKLIPRIDLQVLAAKLEGREVPKKMFAPPPRFMNMDEARQFNFRMERRRDTMTGHYFENIEGMKFKDGFLYKSFSMKSVSTQNIHPTFDELEKFQQPSEDGDADDNWACFSTLFANRKKGHFLKGDRVIVVGGDLKNLKGSVEKVDETTVYIKPDEKGLTRTTLAISDKELCKYFEPGNHVKVIAGSTEGATGIVASVNGHLINIVSDTTEELHRVFADNVVQSSQVTTGECHALFGRSVGPNTGGSFSSKFAAPPRDHPVAAPVRSQSGGRFRGGTGRGGGRGQDNLVGAAIKIRLGPYKGCTGIVKEVRGNSSIRVELEAQMRVVTVNRDQIAENAKVSATFRGKSRTGLGSETPVHPSQTPVRSYMMTPMRDLGASTSVHDGMRTPMHDRAWNPYTPISPPRGDDNWEDRIPSTPAASSPYLPATPDGFNMMMMSPDMNDDVPSLLPEILVNIRGGHGGEGGGDNIGVVREVLQDGCSCRVALGRSGNGASITTAAVEVVAPRKSDKIKILGGANRGATGKLVAIDGTDGIVKVDGNFGGDTKILNLEILASLP